MMLKESVTRGGRPLLTRIRLATDRTGGFYLHRLDAPDSGAPHDHPWTFWSFVVTGSYTEDVYHDAEILDRAETHHRKRWSVHRMSMDSAHLITHIEPHTRTIVLRGPRRRLWGFWTKDGWVSHFDMGEE